MNLKNIGASTRLTTSLPVNGRSKSSAPIPEHFPSNLTTHELRRIVAEMVDLHLWKRKREGHPAIYSAPRFSRSRLSALRAS